MFLRMIVPVRFIVSTQYNFKPLGCLPCKYESSQPLHSLQRKRHKEDSWVGWDGATEQFIKPESNREEGRTKRPVRYVRCPIRMTGEKIEGTSNTMDLGLKDSPKGKTSEYKQRILEEIVEEVYRVCNAYNVHEMIRVSRLVFLQCDMWQSIPLSPTRG